MDFYTVVKALSVGDDWVLDVLVAPFGAPWKKDGHGEWFSPRTNVRADWFPSPAVLYYHGYDEAGQQPEPDEIGRVLERSVKNDGIWFRVVLDQVNDYARRVWDAAQRGVARASPGSLAHLVRKAKDGELLHWPIAEISVFDTDGGKQPASPYAVALPALKARYSSYMEEPMSEPQGPQTENDPVLVDPASIDVAISQAFQAGRGSVARLTDEQLQASIKTALERQQAQARMTRQQEEAQQAAIDQNNKEWEARVQELERVARRLPGGELDYGAFSRSPHAAKFAELRPYDAMSAPDLALMVGILDAAKRGGRSVYGASGSAYKALVVKMSEDDSEGSRIGMHALKMAGAPLPVGGAVKANELMRNDYSNHGQQWVSAAWSSMLWERIRQQAVILSHIRQIEIPQGAATLTLPVETGGFTFYKVARAADTGASGWPDATIAPSKGTTANKVLTPGKMGARALWNGELEEDSLIPFVDWVRGSLEQDGAEYLESIILDGDTDATATTNINFINGTPNAADYYLIANGMRKVALLGVAGANARSAGTLEDTDFLETVKLMGPGGLNALDRTKVGFIIDINTNWKSLTLPTLKTRDVNSNPTIENGRLTLIYGYPVYTSAQMHRTSAKRMAQSADGKIHGTDSNNTTGSILAVRWDQWIFGWKRPMKLEVTRIPRADSDEIVATMRFDLAYRDDEAAAISYGVAL